MSGVRGSGPEFVSPHCVLGRHSVCGDGEPRDSGVPGVRHLVCGCGCHRRTPPPPPDGPAPAGAREAWYRLCWTLRRRPLVPGVEYGVLIGRSVPALLRGMRGCLAPPAFHDPVHVRRVADTEGGWSYRTGALAVRAHRLTDSADFTDSADWSPLFACPLRDVRTGPRSDTGEGR